MKTALIRYIKNAMSGVAKTGHAAEWKAYTVGRAFQDLGYTLNIINWKNEHYQPDRTYDVVFDIRFLDRLTAAFHKDTIKFLHLTSGDDNFRNQAEQARIAEVNARRGCNLSPTRKVRNAEDTYQAIDLADDVMLVGNLTTLHTYPERYWDKIKPIDTVASYTGDLMAKALFRYTGFNFESMPNYNGHGTKWTYYFLYKLFEGLGYDIKLLPWQENGYKAEQVYDVVFSIVNFLNCIEGFGP